jgi:hypothetical protein
MHHARSKEVIIHERWCIFLLEDERARSEDDHHIFCIGDFSATEKERGDDEGRERIHSS